MISRKKKCEVDHKTPEQSPKVTQLKVVQSQQAAPGQIKQEIVLLQEKIKKLVEKDPGKAAILLSLWIKKK